MNLQIRPLTSQHQPFLWDMLYEALFVAEGQVALPRALIQQPGLARYVADWGRSHDTGFLASDADTNQLVGAVWLRLLVGQNRGYGHVNDDTPELSMAIFPQYRAQGIGTQLLGRLLATQGARSAISLSVSAGNPARRLYERFGFEIVGHSDASFTMLRRCANS